MKARNFRIRDSVKRRRLVKKILFYSICALFLLAAALYFFIFSGGSIQKALLTGKRINILAIGVDSEKKVGRSDTILLISYNPGTKKAEVISIPRDTLIKVDSRGGIRMDKINHILPRKGLSFTVKTIEDMLEISIPYHIILDYRGFENIVDIIGGVPVYIPDPMKYTDRAQDLFINLPSGMQILDGKKALQFVRYRADRLGDIGRITRQHDFLRAVAIEVKKPSNYIVKSPKILRQIYKYTRTSLSFRDFIALSRIIFKISEKDINTVKIPGTPAYINGIDYWNIDKHAFKKMVEDIDRELSAAEKKRGPGRPVKVQILNGSGHEGIGLKIRNKFLSNRDMDIVEIGNADRFDYGTTLIISRTRDMDGARKVYDIIKQGDLVEKIDESLMVDVTVIIGGDFKL